MKLKTLLLITLLLTQSAYSNDERTYDSSLKCSERVRYGKSFYFDYKLSKALKTKERVCIKVRGKKEASEIAENVQEWIDAATKYGGSAKIIEEQEISEDKTRGGYRLIFDFILDVAIDLADQVLKSKVKGYDVDIFVDQKSGYIKKIVFEYREN